MGTHRIRRGLRLPIDGAPGRALEDAAPSRAVALLGADYVGLRPRLHAQVGDAVERGTLLFEDKRTPGVRFTAPASGRVLAIHRGARRAFESIVVACSSEQTDLAFSSFSARHPQDLDREAIVALLLESGQWTALRRRPFSRVANPTERPRSIFVTAIDTQPLAPDVSVMLHGREDDLDRGLHVLAALTDGPIFVCADATTAIDLPDDARFRLERFDGPHPAGTVGLHIHRLDPVDRDHFVWHLGIQDVLAIGSLFETGRLDVMRIVSLAGPAVRAPRLLRTRLGADLDTLTADTLVPGELRVLSGSVLAGRSARGDVHGYLGRYHQQVCGLHEQRHREFLGWLAPGRGKFSVTRTFLSRLLRRASFPLGTSTGGSPRAIVPIGVYEKVLPMDLEPTFLLKALAMRDVEWAERLGCLELDEEDLALCAFVDPGKADFGGALREVLTILEEEAQAA